MAQKPRSQVNYQPGQLSAIPSIQPVGGTNQAVVQGIPKDNNYLKLSRSLAQFSNLLGQVSNINQMRGKDFAQGLSAEDLDDIITGKVPDPEGGPLGALGFQKAFQQVATKRWYDTVGVKKYADLENSIDSKLDDYIKNGYDINKAKELVQEEVGALSMEIQQYFADSPFGNQVSNLLGGELSSRVIAGALKGYEKKQKAYLNGVFEEEVRTDFASVALGKSDESTQGFFKRIEKEFKSKGYAPREITNFYNNLLKDGLDLALATNPDRAAILINDAENLTIGKRPTFGGMDAKLLLSRFKTALDKLDSESSTLKSQTISAASSQFVGGSVETLKQIKLSQDNNQSPLDSQAARQALILTLKPLKLTGANQEPLSEVAITNIVEEILGSANPQTRLSEILLELAAGEFTSNFSREVITRSFDDVLRENSNINLSPSSKFTGATKSQKDQALLKLPGYFEERPKATPELFMREVGITGVAPFTEVEEAFKEARKFDSILPTDEDIVRSLYIELSDLSTKYAKTLGDSALVKATGITARSKEQLNNIKQLLIEYGKSEIAPKGVIPQQGSKAQINQKFQEIIKEEKEDYQRLLEAMSVRKKGSFQLFQELPIDKRNVQFNFTDNNNETSFYDDGEEGSFYGVFNLEANEELAPYKTLNLKIAKKVRDDKKVATQLRDEIDSDIILARSKRDSKALKTLLTFYGLNGLDIETISDDFKIANVWWDEVRIFNDFRSLLKSYDDFAKVIVKATKDENLTETEAKVLDVVTRLGLYEESLEGEPAFALEQFLKVQRQFLVEE